MTNKNPAQILDAYLFPSALSLDSKVLIQSDYFRFACVRMEILLDDYLFPAP